MSVQSGSYSQPDITPAERLRLRARINRARTAAAGLGAASLLDWTQRRRPFLMVGVPFDISAHPYLTGIMLDGSQRVVITKGAQMGISEYLLSYALWTLDARNGSVLYVMPTDSTVSDFSTARLGPALEASPYLERITRGGDERGADRITLKRIGDRFLYMRGGQIAGGRRGGSAPQLKSIPVDAVILDEFDEMDPRVAPLAEKRLGHSRLAEVRIASTPTMPGFGVHAEYQRSDRRQYFVRCGRCGHRQTIGLENLIADKDDSGRPVAWHTAAGAGRGKGVAGDAAPTLLCRKCHRPIDVLAPGEWVAEQPGNPYHGYHVSGLLWHGRDLADILKNLRSTNESKKEQVMNQDLGMPYAPASALAITDATLQACRREYGFGPYRVGKPARLGGSFAGVDVGGVFHVVIRAADWSLRFAGTFRDLAEVDSLMRAHNVLCAVIDSNPETREARRFQARHGAGVVWLCNYDEGRADNAVPEIGPNPERGIVSAARTRTLDSTIDQFMRAARGEPGATLPANVDEVPDYEDQLKSSQRKIETDAKGRPVARYVESGPDHYLHAENYAYIAAQTFLMMRSTSESIVTPLKVIADY